MVVVVAARRRHVHPKQRWVETRVYLPETRTKSNVAAVRKMAGVSRAESDGGRADRIEKMTNLRGDGVKRDCLARSLLLFSTIFFSE
jgi:hypothetical protein